MQFLAFALSRLPDPYAVILGGAVGFFSRVWWQTVLGGLACGMAMVLAFGLFGGMSRDAPAYFVVDALVVAMWSSLAFVLREFLRRRKSA
jgi:hypothetical protein